MTYVKWKLVHTPFISNTWSTASTTVLSDFLQPMVTKALGTAKDSFKFKVSNPFNTYNNFFNTNDKIEIYRVTNTETIGSANLLMTGTISTPEYDIDDNGSMVSVSGYSFSEYVLRAITNVDASATTIPYAIKRGIEWVGGATGGQFNITWSATNPMVMSTGAAFPIVGEAWFNTPLYTKIEKWSTSKATGDGYYYFYVDLNNQFQWFRGANTTSRIFNSTTNAYKSLKHDVDKDGIINFVICKGGTDPSGKPIETKYVDAISFAKNGQKYYMLVSQKNTAQNLTQQDFLKSYGTTSSATNYPNLTASFTTAWNAQQSSGTVAGVTITKGSPVTINKGSESANKDAYVAIIRAEIIQRLKDEAAAYCQDVRFGKLVLDIEFEVGTVDWQLGDRVQCTLPSMSLNAKELRVTNIQYTTEGDTFTLKEDLGTI